MIYKHQERVERLRHWHPMLAQRGRNLPAERPVVALGLVRTSFQGLDQPPVGGDLGQQCAELGQDEARMTQPERKVAVVIVDLSEGGLPRGRAGLAVSTRIVRQAVHVTDQIYVKEVMKRGINSDSPDADRPAVIRADYSIRTQMGCRLCVVGDEGLIDVLRPIVLGCR